MHPLYSITFKKNRHNILIITLTFQVQQAKTTILEVVLAEMCIVFYGNYVLFTF